MTTLVLEEHIEAQATLGRFLPTKIDHHKPYLDLNCGDLCMK